MWGSFPCQDLSLAGVGAGLKGERSGTFYPFWDVVRALKAEGRAPKLIALENVCGTLTSHGGKDFEAICRTFAEAGYRCGALVINADLFVPQSRPRLFVIGVRADVAIDPALLVARAPRPLPHPRPVPRPSRRCPGRCAPTCCGGTCRRPAAGSRTFAELIEETPDQRRLAHPRRDRAAAGQDVAAQQGQGRPPAKRAGRRMVGGVYKRTRLDERGVEGPARRGPVRRCRRLPAHPGRRLQPPGHPGHRRARRSARA